jgi:ornithine--oxo-acid transaminase
LALLRDDKLAERASRLGAQVIDRLRAARLPHVKEVRGQGMLIGVDLEESSGGARRYCERIAQEGVLCKETHTYVIRIAPPLTIAEDELQKGVDTIIRVVRELA